MVAPEATPVGIRIGTGIPASIAGETRGINYQWFDLSRLPHGPLWLQALYIRQLGLEHTGRACFKKLDVRSFSEVSHTP